VEENPKSKTNQRNEDKGTTDKKELVPTDKGTCSDQKDRQ
jgi:hypothetical protein